MFTSTPETTPSVSEITSAEPSTEQSIPQQMRSDSPNTNIDNSATQVDTNNSGNVS